MRYHRIPDETVRRLPIYLRTLLDLQQEGEENISSRKLADCLHLNSPQIRKDFSYFGEFGVPGRGYEIDRLIKETRKILKLDGARKVVLAGAGRLGSAILAYSGFKKYGFDIGAIFDADPKKVGKKIHGVTVESISGIKHLKREKVNLAIVAVPQDAAQQVACLLVKAGVCGILNFAPCTLTVPKKVKLINIDIAMDLARLPYYLPTA
ncbi:MAG: redox-sensing transcriptional repressor Rex [Planctomycetota bacterium]|jgi:redox-sensing transcriptional repressor